MGVILEDAPWWLEAAHPETRYVNANDHAQRLEGSGNNVSGGWRGLCLDWQPVRDASSKYIREMANVVSAHPSMYAYDAATAATAGTACPLPGKTAGASEYAYCYCPSAIAEFQKWSAETLLHDRPTQRRMGEKLSNFSTIDPPREQRTYMDWSIGAGTSLSGAHQSCASGWKTCARPIRKAGWKDTPDGK